MSNNSKNSNGLSFIAGLLIGGATLYYLNTPQGRKLTETALAKGSELSKIAQEKAEEVKAKVADTATMVKEKAVDVIEKGNSSLKEAREIVQNKVETLLPDNTTVKDFKAGVAAAKSKLNNVDS